MGMDQYRLIPFLGGWTSIYQLFWYSPGVQGFDILPNGFLAFWAFWTFKTIFFSISGAKNEAWGCRAPLPPRPHLFPVISATSCNLVRWNSENKNGYIDEFIQWYPVDGMGYLFFRQTHSRKVCRYVLTAILRRSNCSNLCCDVFSGIVWPQGADFAVTWALKSFDIGERLILWCIISKRFEMVR